MRALLLIVEMLAIIAALIAAVGAVLYGFSWTVLLLVRFFPIIGKRHKHEKWDELTKRSGRH
jgi:hypothetical protein